MNVLAQELRRALAFRTGALSDHIVARRARLSRDNPASRVLEIASKFPHRLQEAVDRFCERNPDPDSQIETLRLLLRHTTNVILLVEDRLSRDAYSAAPPYLRSSLRRSCDAIDLSDYVPILSVGHANNFDTDSIEIEELIFGRFEKSPGFLHFIRVFLQVHCQDLPNRYDERHYISMSAPRIEGQSILWTPILLGHELAHMVTSTDDLKDLNDVLWFDNSDFWKDIRNIREYEELVDVALSWTVELVCDAYALRTFGVSGIAALAEFLEVTNQIDHASTTHPPGRLRIELMLNWISQDVGILTPIVEPWRHYGEPRNCSGAKLNKYPARLHSLVKILARSGNLIYEASSVLPGSDYDYLNRTNLIDAIASDLQAGMPCDLEYNASSVNQPTPKSHDKEVGEADVVSATWLARSHELHPQYVALAKKSLESIDFVSQWRQADEPWISPTDEPKDNDSHVREFGSVLSAEEIRHRLNAKEKKYRLIVRPYSQLFIKDASLDIRLGSQFIVFIRSGIGSFDPLRPNYDPRSMQRLIQLSWGEQFILHPGELVLASTLEYFVLPADLTAQVITRSSYGRLGLLSATAIQVQPQYHGCLTLELVNLGTVPLELTPGERIAQLVILHTTPPPKATPPPQEADKPIDPDRGEGSNKREYLDEPKYHCTVGPEFSRVQKDREVGVLRRLRDSLIVSDYPLPD